MSVVTKNSAACTVQDEFENIFGDNRLFVINSSFSWSWNVFASLIKRPETRVNLHALVRIIKKVAENART